MADSTCISLSVKRREAYRISKIVNTRPREHVKIPTNILAERLRRIEEFGLVTKSPYQTNPLRFEFTLTEKGKALEPILNEMARWGLHYIKGTKLILKVSSQM